MPKTKWAKIMIDGKKIEAREGKPLLKQIHEFFGSKEHMAGIRGFKIGEKLLEEAN